MLRFSVSDTGIGVPQEQQEAIFKPFIQADGSTTRKYGGTGLGLAISTNLVALLGGRIWLESETGKGSTFHFTVSFGLQQTPVPEATARDAQMTRLRDMPVLVVDDNAVNRRILEATLRRWHMKPVLAESGRAGVAAMRERQAGRSGLSPCLARRADAGDGRILRGRRDQEGSRAGGGHHRDADLRGTAGDGARCRALGIAAYLMKPISQSELLEAILAVLGTPSDGPDRLKWSRVTPCAKAGGKLRILLAEDNKVNQMVAARLLEKRGHTVVIAGNGQRSAGGPG